MTKRKPSIVGNYRFTGKVLGKGNFARVEEACHEIIGSKVAIKIMDINNIKEEYVIKNLFREARIMSRLKHPCIATLFETMQRSDNTYYLVTEIVNGGDLCTFVKAQRTGKLEERAARFFAQQFVSALAYMHQRGIVHRDLKMENVMLNSVQNQIKIVDFGLSNEWNPDSPLKTHCGSPEYAAPELFVTSKVYGPEVDLWSLGIILFGMVVGQLPFVSNKTGNTTSQERRKILVAQINKGMASPQRKAIAHFSFEFRNAMCRLLNADATKRITVKELIIHPWITENGKKFVRTNPIKKLTQALHNKILNDISALTTVGITEIAKKVKDEPFCKAGGMYNILLHTFLIKNFTPDQISKCLSSVIAVPSLVKKFKEESTRYIETSARTEVSKKNSQTCSSRPRTAIGANRSPIAIAPHSNVVKKVSIQEPLTPSSESFNKQINQYAHHSLIPKLRPKSSQLGKIRPTSEPNSRTNQGSALAKRQQYSATIDARILQKRISKHQVDEVKLTQSAKRVASKSTQTPRCDPMAAMLKTWKDTIEAVAKGSNNSQTHGENKGSKTPRKKTINLAQDVKIFKAVSTKPNEMCVVGHNGRSDGFSVRRKETTRNAHLQRSMTPLSPRRSVNISRENRHSKSATAATIQKRPYMQKIENIRRPLRKNMIPVCESKTQPTNPINITKTYEIYLQKLLKKDDSKRHMSHPDHENILPYHKFERHQRPVYTKKPFSRLETSPIARKIAFFLEASFRNYKHLL